MKTKLIPLVLLLLAALNSLSQVTNYDIGTYRVPDVKWRMLETNFGFSGSSQNSKSTYNTITSENTGNNNRGNLGLYFYQFRNTDVLQQEISSRLNSGYAIENSTGSAVSSSRYYQPLIFSGMIINRRYFRGRVFYETNLDLRNSKTSRFLKQPEIYAYEGREAQQNIEINIPLKIGYGRIEQVQDARQAIYIFDELARVERTDINKTDENIIELAQHISRLRNTRIFDSRIRWMEQVESLDSLLLANNHVTQQDSRYFTTLADMWGYAGFPIRRSGNRISLALNPRYRHINNSSTDAQTGNRYNSIGYRFDVNAGIEFMHEKPLNLHWQNSFSANAYYIYYKVKNSDFAPAFQTAVAHSIGFYPNTRTEMMLSNGIEYYAEMMENTLNKREYDNFRFRSDLSISYYFSPRLRIQANANFATSGDNFNVFYFNEIFGTILSNRRAGFYYNMELIYKIF
jgi:hypothetical protein